MDQQLIATRLKELLTQVLARNGEEPRTIDMQSGFAELGVNSVDLLEFVLGLEDGFGVRVLDDMLPEDLPTTLAQWADLLQNRTQKKAAA
jgi:acyl carrier protein